MCSSPECARVMKSILSGSIDSLAGTSTSNFGSFCLKTESRGEKGNSYRVDFGKKEGYSSSFSASSIGNYTMTSSGGYDDSRTSDALASLAAYSSKVGGYSKQSPGVGVYEEASA